MINQILFHLGNSSFFASRAFLPPLMIILSFRFPEYFPVLDTGIEVPSSSSWFFSDASLYSFLVLAGAEMAALKIEMIRNLFDPFMKKVRVAMAFVVNMALLSPDTASVLTHIHTAGFSVTQLLALLPSIITHYLGLIREGIYEFLEDFDDDDDLKLRTTFSFLEDFSVIIGIILLIALPILVLSIVGIVLLVLWVVKRHFAKIEDSTRITCSGCNSLMLPASTKCFSCHTKVPEPSALGLLGQMKDKPSLNPDKQEILLLNARRCPHCAEKLQRSKTVQACSTCGYELKPQILGALIDAKKKELIRGMVVTALVGLIPIVGMIFAILYTRMIFVKPLKQYVPKGKARLGKIILKLSAFVLIFVQVIPLIGLIAPPLLLLINYMLWKSLLVKEVQPINSGQ